MPKPAIETKKDPTTGLDDGKGIAALMRPFHQLLVAGAFTDAADDGVSIAFDLENEYVQTVLDQLAKRVTSVAETTKDEIRALVGRQAQDGWSAERLAKEIRDKGTIASRSRAMLISRTESAAAFSQGSLAAYRASGVVKQVAWLLGPEPCPECAGLADVVVDLGEEFAPGVNAPPAHPNCTCSLSPLVDTAPAATDGGFTAFEDAASADAWGQEAYADWRDGLSEDERDELTLYQSTAYKYVNRSLRAGEALDSDDADTVKAIDAALSRATLPRDVVTYRGFSSPDILDRFADLEGQIISDKAFGSTSLDRASGDKFRRYAAEDGVDAILAEIRVPKGTNGAYLEGLLNMKEYEILLPRDTAMRVVSTNIDADGVRHMVMEVVNGD